MAAKKRGGGRVRTLTNVQLVNMGKGQYRIPAFGTRNQSSGSGTREAGVSKR